MSNASLFAPVCSITPTRRRRFLWAAWWTREPSRSPFVKPDAARGGARTREEALSEAEKAAGCRLTQIDGSWARAWARVLVGEAPFAEPSARTERPKRLPGSREERRPTSAYQVLGIDSRASLEEIKRAYRKRALETHPDRGGSNEAFRAVQSAFERIQLKKRRPRH
ncbi:MAG: J domain-containing protein [Myxococcota bacterium]